MSDFCSFISSISLTSLLSHTTSALCIFAQVRYIHTGLQDQHTIDNKQSIIPEKRVTNRKSSKSVDQQVDSQS